MFFDILENIGKWSLSNINTTSKIISLNNINGGISVYNDFIDN